MRSLRTVVRHGEEIAEARAGGPEQSLSVLLRPIRITKKICQTMPPDWSGEASNVTGRRGVSMQGGSAAVERRVAGPAAMISESIIGS